MMQQLLDGEDAPDSSYKVDSTCEALNKLGLEENKFLKMIALSNDSMGSVASVR